MLNEELLQTLVSIVDAQLLETIRLKILETENVKNSYGVAMCGITPWPGISRNFY